MNQRWYTKTTERDMRGLQVRSLFPLRNGLGELPKGTIFTIDRKQGGLHLKSLPCSDCGMALSITHVLPQDVELA